MEFAQRLSRLVDENAFQVLAEVNRLKAAGHDIISFAIGEPDFKTAENIKQACIRALQEDHTYYCQSEGILPLRTAIADHVGKTRGIKVLPEEVVITPGGKPIIYNAIHALLNPGDEAIYPNPGFPIYESIIRYVGGTPIPIPLLEEKDFSIDTADLRKLITPRTKLIILNSPHNPTGGMLSKRDLEDIAQIAIEHDLWVLSDEIYSRLIYEGQFNSIISLPGMRERTILLDGFSKAYAMTGWRLGYGVMSSDMAVNITKLVTNTESCTNTFIQFAAVEALTGPQDHVEAMVKEFKERRDMIVSGLNSIPGFNCHTPNGAFYAFPNVTEACRRYRFKDAQELQDYLLHEGHVATIPRSAFGNINPGEREEYIRFTYATSRKKIADGLTRIKDALAARA